VPATPRIWIAGDDPAWREQIADELGDLPLADDLHEADVAVISATYWRNNRTELWIPAILIGVPVDPELCAAEASGELYQLLPFERRPGELVASCRRAGALSTLLSNVGAVKQTELYDALDQLGRTIGELSSHEELAQAAASAASEFIECDLVAFLLATDDGGGVLQLHLGRPIAGAMLQQLRDDIIERFRGLSGDVTESGLAVHVSGAAVIETTAEPGSPELQVLHQSIDLPGEAIGLVSLCRLGGPPFGSDEARTAEHFTSRVAESVDRVSLRWATERRRLSLMVESMADGLILTDRYSDRVLINPAARRLLKLDAGELTQSDLRDHLGFYPFDLVATSENVAPLHEEVTLHDKTLHSMISPVRDGDGKLLGVVVVLRDFTEAKALAVRQKEFVSVVSHELRTPLTSISGALDIALSDYAGRLNDKQRRYLTMARESCTRLNAIVDDLLDVARSEEGRMPIRFTPLALDELGREVAESYRPAAQAKNIRLHVSREDTNMRIAGDADRLTQVLNNLLSNALKFTPEGGTIEVEIFGPAVAEGHVGVSVANTGEPIPESDRERIFEKFEQLEGSATRRFGGTGLGLAISRAIVEAHRGRIWVDADNQGTKFVFTLPVAPDAEEPPGELELAPVDAPVGGARILVVEPDVHSSYILKGILMGAGHKVRVVQSPASALTVARREVPDLVVVAAVPGDEDLAIIEILRHDPETHKCAIVGIGEPESVEAFAARGAHTFVPKPVDPARLGEAVNRLIADAGRAATSRILIIDDDLSIRIICREVLTSAGYKVRTAASGEAGLTEAKEFRPDLILLDVMMPELDGFATAERFAADAATALTPIIFLSARGETEDKVRAFRLGAEDYMVKPFIADEMLARVRKALDRRARELGASPTTQLPGSAAIEAEIERRLGDSMVTFCYLDLDNLKAFNDYYGYAKADGVIRQTGDLVRDVIRREGDESDFIGHIAGDDFVFITGANRADVVCQTICKTFDRLIPLYYNKVDRERGYIETKDRYGVLRRFPIMGVSLAAVSGGDVTSYSQLAAAAAEGKKLAKTLERSSYVRDGAVIFGETSDETAVG
jgi:signal transduction histidine kinase/DNA-binding response OmpR family regulator